MILDDAADPTLIARLADRAPPEKATTVAVPDWPVDTSLTVTCPLCVRPSAGSIWPSVVVNVMTVPL
jgi:hypothetical protein